MDHPHNDPRFVLGRSRLARAMGLLLSRNDLSHSELGIFADWAAINANRKRAEEGQGGLEDEELRRGSWLAKSQISTILNAKLPKPGAQIFLSLAQVNSALAELAAGHRPAEPLPPKLRRLAVPPGPWFLAHPITGMPLSSGDWFMIYTGEFTTDELEDLPEIFSRETAAAASDRLALLAQGWMAQQRLSWRAGREEIASLYKVSDRGRRDRLLEVLEGGRRFTGGELDEEREALRFLVGRLLGRDALAVREFDRWIRGQLEE